MRIIETELAEVKLLEPQVYSDERGSVFESYQKERYDVAGALGPFVQDNLVGSKLGVLRGLHYQLQQPQAKLVTVTSGKIFDVAVDIRRNSVTFGKWIGYELSVENRRQLYVPEGFAHGYYVLSDWADVWYKCTNYYHPDDDYGILWNDTAIAVVWPLVNDAPILSAKDRDRRCLEDIAEELLPTI
ncbi:MAG: dTDP-4-dehydrorhamnose 3,5-epimerase [Gammaproteobacteria bacterium]|nr:dTDP-4-dehydrorhamnose 3,5-epimerase [Gammaproteobacteria bacterium]